MQSLFGRCATSLAAAALLVAGLAASQAVYADACSADNSEPGMEQLYATGWGIDQRNSRYQPRSTLSTKNAGSLKIKWTYGLRNRTPRSYPLVTEDTLFIGDGARGVVALDRETGCERWVFDYEGDVVTAIVHATINGQPGLIFTDRSLGKGGVYALYAKTGEQVWHTKIEDEPVPWYSGTPLVNGDTAYIPVASMEVVLAINPLYGCCTTSGGMAALDVNTGKKRWYVPTIAEVAKPTKRHWLFVQRHGPSGAPVWGAPSFDAKRNRVIFGTGQNYTHPATDTSDAIFALDAATGERIWKHQYTANDVYTAACNNEAWNHPNCDKPTGPDVDFGAPTMIARDASGRDLVIAGQKSADAHAIDPGGN